MPQATDAEADGDPTAPPDPPSPARGIDLSVSGRAEIAGKPVFGPLSIDLPAGRWTCLLGPSGVGKSTLLHLLAGIGAATLADGRIAATDGRPLAGRVALMAQSDMLLPWLTARGNVLIGARLRGTRGDTGRADAILARMGLRGFETRKPRALSGGQRQRVALARTLMEDRPLVLLDEPFSALDVATRTRMQDLAVAELAGRTVFHVTHDPAEAARLGQVILLMHPRGIEPVAPPPGAIPRPFGDRAVLDLQADLLDRLRSAA